MKIKSPDWIDAHETLPGDDMYCYVLCKKEFPNETRYVVHENVTFFTDFRQHYGPISGAMVPIPAFCTYDRYEEEYDILDDVVAWLPSSTTFALEEDNK